MTSAARREWREAARKPSLSIRVFPFRSEMGCLPSSLALIFAAVFY